MGDEVSLEDRQIATLALVACIVTDTVVVFGRVCEVGIREGLMAFV